MPPTAGWSERVTAVRMWRSCSWKCRFLLLALWWYRRGGTVAAVVLTGLLSFFTYYYVSMTFATAQNRLFPLYVAAASLAGFTLVVVARRIDPIRIAASDEEREIVRHVAHHLLAAHHWGTTAEAKIMLVHAALEYLSWVTYVLTKKRTPSQHAKEDKNRTPAATWHLKELLRPAKIKVAIPSQLAALRKFARQEGLPNGPSAVSRLRNKLVHPKDAGEPYRIEGLVFQAWQLASEYGELLLLKRIGYRGKYLPRTDMRGWVDTVPVPWAK